jgi:signal transduction histidine kinase
MTFVLGLISCFLIATGALFILLEWRTHFDKSFKYFGYSLILLSTMTSIDLWVLPGVDSDASHLMWQRIYHLIALVYIPFSLSFLRTITDKGSDFGIRAFTFAGLLFSPALFLNSTLTVQDGMLHGGVIYLAIFAPLVLGYISYAIILLIQGLNNPARPQSRKVLVLHLVGFIGLCLGAVFDMLSVATPISDDFPSATILGVFAYGIVASLILTERFLDLLRERDNTLRKLQGAYKDLEQAGALRQLGESTAIINHEIKNYLFMISGNAQLLEEVERLSDKGREIVGNILNSVDRMTRFSQEILEMSRVQVIAERHPINLSQMLLGLIEKYYANRRSSIDLKGVAREQFIHGDWGKLEQVFVNLFNNAFDASRSDQTPDIRVKVSAGPHVVLVSVEDDGVGCDYEATQNLFKAFYTTRKAKGGTGLGLSISRTIMESHGGRISVYSKNLTPGEETGLRFQLTFPNYDPDSVAETERKYPIIVVKESLPKLQDLIRVFQNVRITPYFVQDVPELLQQNFTPNGVMVLMNPALMAQEFSKLTQYSKICLVSEHRGALFILDHARGKRPQLFSEEFVLQYLIPRQPAALRGRQGERQVATDLAVVKMD